jgi:hypothetical protein
VSPSAVDVGGHDPRAELEQVRVPRVDRRRDQCVLRLPNPLDAGELGEHLATGQLPPTAWVGFGAARRIHVFGVAKLAIASATTITDLATDQEVRAVL